MLISASEHYGSVINRPFDFEKYLDDAAAHRMTMTRTFLFTASCRARGIPLRPASRSRRILSRPMCAAAPG